MWCRMNEIIQIIGKLLTILKLRGYINDNDYALILGRIEVDEYNEREKARSKDETLQ